MMVTFLSADKTRAKVYQPADKTIFGSILEQNVSGLDISV